MTINYIDHQCTGYECVRQTSLRKFIPRGMSFNNTLCISDTHFHGEHSAFNNDLPEEVLYILKEHPGFHVFWLGDVIESLHLDRKGIERVKQNRLIKEIAKDLNKRKHVKIILGNHDKNICTAMGNIFGHEKISLNGFLVGRVIFVHGHESSLDRFSYDVPIPKIVTPSSGLLQRIGMYKNQDNTGNKIIGEYYSRKKLYPIFGHTHSAEITTRYANCGCILINSQSFLTIIDNILQLWRPKQ